jgi:hypothetical protein
MKRLNKHLTKTFLLGLSLVWGATAPGQVIGQWDFNSSNLVQSAGSSLGDLQYADGAGGATQLGTAFGSTTALGIPDINGAPAAVMGFPAATNGMGYSFSAPLGGNGGGSQVNQWTLIADLLYPSGSDNKDRPIIDADGVVQSSGNLFFAGPEFAVSASDGVGAPTGPYFGLVKPNTWYRLAVVANTNQVSFYINGVRVGSIPNTGQLDTRFALGAGSSILVLGTILDSAAPGFINSMQVRDVALNAGQLQALGGPSVAGIPQTIPPVPAFIDSSTPSSGASGVGPLPAINVVLNQGDTTVDSASIKLFFDGALLPASVTATSPTFQIAAAITNILDPSSIHNLTLAWHDSVAGATSNTWSFTVVAYQNISLPTPFYLETFDGLTENASGPTPLPPGWTVDNQSWPQTSGFSLDDLSSDSYADWVLISSDREFSWAGGSVKEPADRTDLPPIVLNGQLLSISNFLSGNLMWAESDQRCGSCWGQYQEMFTGDIDCSGRSNVFVAFNSFYEQNQDNMNLVEYSIDGGTNWMPVRYFFCTQGGGEQSDIYYTNNAAGKPVIDIGQTFSLPDPNRNWAPWPAGCTDTSVCPPNSTNYGIYVKAPISTNMIPFIVGYTNDDTMSSKEIVVVRLAQADGQKKVRFRFLDDGTSSWFWGIDNFGLYEINTPVINTQPQSQTIDAGTPVTFSVSASSASALTYQWQFNGINIAGATNASFTLQTVAPADAGQYKVIVKNGDGNTPSAPATLSVNTTPAITGPLVSQVVDVGSAVSFAPTVSGGHPLSYLWYLNGGLLSANGNSLSISSAKVSDSGNYQLILTNSYGSITSSVAHLTVVSGPVTNGLVVHLTFDGNLTDTSGRGNDATYATNGTAADPNPTFVPGKLGQAFEYTTLKDKTKMDYATFGYPPDLMLDTNSFSVSMWVNYTNQDDDLPFISNKNWNSSGNRGWGIFCQGGGNFRLNITGPNGGADKLDTSPGTVLRDGNWHNVIMSVVRDGAAAGAAAAYVDGTPVFQGTITTVGSIDTAGLPFQNDQGMTSSQATWAVNIGQDGTGVYTDKGGAYNIGAKMDDLGIWRRALSPGEAAAIYAAGQAGKDLTHAQVSASPANPTLTVTLVGGSVKIDWQGSATGRLQTTTSLSPAIWSDVPGTTGASTATVSISSASSFFRVKQ